MSSDETSIEKALGEQLQEAAAELEVRRKAVTAEIMAMIQERAEDVDWAANKNRMTFHIIHDPKLGMHPVLDEHFVRQAAEVLWILVEGAMARGAGAQLEPAPADAGPAQPPATAESLGGES